jgi:hypothetical protein
MRLLLQSSAAACEWLRLVGFKGGCWGSGGGAAATARHSFSMQPGIYGTLNRSEVTGSDRWRVRQARDKSASYSRNIYRVGHGAALEHLLIDSFAGLVMAGVASLDRVAQDGVRGRASAGAASFRRHSTFEDCRDEAAQAVRRLQEEASRDPCVASRREAAARLRAACDRERRIEKALTLTRELHGQQQVLARRREERAFR